MNESEWAGLCMGVFGSLGVWCVHKLFTTPVFAPVSQDNVRRRFAKEYAKPTPFEAAIAGGEIPRPAACPVPALQAQIPALPAKCECTDCNPGHLPVVFTRQTILLVFRSIYQTELQQGRTKVYLDGVRDGLGKAGALLDQLAGKYAAAAQAGK